jgi:hypothetical protein
MRPISSMCPANMTRGRPAPLSVANEFPATSARTSSAKRCASARHTRAGAASKAEGPGVSSRDLRKASDSGVMDMAVRRATKVAGTRPLVYPSSALRFSSRKSVPGIGL